MWVSHASYKCWPCFYTFLAWKPVIIKECELYNSRLLLLWSAQPPEIPKYHAFMLPTVHSKMAPLRMVQFDGTAQASSVFNTGCVSTRRHKHDSNEGFLSPSSWNKISHLQESNPRSREFYYIEPGPLAPLRVMMFKKKLFLILLFKTEAIE